MKTTGGGGGRIVINPTELRRNAQRLRGLGADLNTVQGRLRGAAIPAMPADLIGGIRAGVEGAAALLARIPDALDDGATELQRRALWAEIADQLIAGVPLSGAQLAEFMAGLRDGTLVKYAEPWQAELAGAYVAGLYADNYKQPEKLLELAAILDASQGHADSTGAFMAGFVERFGTRMADIPRVIQAMEWTPGMGFGGSYADPFVDWDLGRELFDDGYELPDGVDPVELLGIFSMALAVATSSGGVSRQVEHDIAWDEDRWAVAQLLHEGTFGANFLKEAFQSVVVSDIQRDAALFGPDLTGFMQIGMGDNEGPTIPTDERRLVLEALLRNPEGAALALSTPLPEEVYIASSWAPVETRDPIGVLYAADWDDDGKLLADLYSDATNWAQAEADAPGTSAEGNRITLQLIERISNAQRDDLGVVTNALVEDLGRHHVRGLIEMGSGSGVAVDGDKGWIDASTGRIALSAEQSEQLFVGIAENEDADAVLMRELGEGQASYLAEMVREHPERAEEWGAQVGTLNQYVLNAHDLEREIEFGEASDRQKIGLSLFTAGLGALTEGTPYGVLVGPVGTLVDIGTSPSHLDVDNASFADKLDTIGTTKAMVATAAQVYGSAPGPDAQQAFLIVDGQLVDYSELSGPLRHEFDQWVTRARTEDETLDRALGALSDAMFEHER